MIERARAQCVEVFDGVTNGGQQAGIYRLLSYRGYCSYFQFPSEE